MKSATSTSRCRPGSELRHRRGAVALCLWAALWAPAPPGGAQEGAALAVATLDQDALFLRSQFGQRIQADLQRARDALAAENRRIEADLIAEEEALTERRGTLPPEEFAGLARTFDEKVQRIREEQDLKARQLQQRLERNRQRFFSEIAPLLNDLLVSRGTQVLLDANAVLLAVEGIDITEEAIAAIDAAIGAGGEPGLGLPDAPTQDGEGAAE